MIFGLKRHSLECLRRRRYGASGASGVISESRWRLSANMLPATRLNLQPRMISSGKRFHRIRAWPGRVKIPQ
jgi:hypothetical protein